MPGFLLHSGATANCTHLGIATPMQVSTQVFVSGQPIVTQASTYGIAACQFPTMTSGAPPCVTASWVKAATQVLSDGIPVLLSDSVSLCKPTPAPLLVTATQLLVIGT
ncbi:hypothetical protein M0D69_16870 [Caballeronia sp. SEWSISQ10-4 2]|uniref:hypothetical protein n=1 Tax=Caballeronia sp. SEWSISQ10-4 2 TaxID=2937438 RepID=UPI00264B21BE|nr:hypothetical protein [Caballeronia sp. SEWSISQ10-4 2]MDN7179630.1 hypothetical protein [Caballeronia sp. SEWSISQ10-4 2]